MLDKPVWDEQKHHRADHNGSMVLIFEPTDRPFLHMSPVWWDRANWTFKAFVENEDGENQWEELHGQITMTERRLILCCIPFFTYDLALGDEVEVNEQMELVRVVTRSKLTTFRIWFGGQSEETIEQVVGELEPMKVIMEWSSKYLLALAVHTGVDEQNLIGYLKAGKYYGRFDYEPGYTQPQE